MACILVGKKAVTEAGADLDVACWGGQPLGTPAHDVALCFGRDASPLNIESLSLSHPPWWAYFLRHEIELPELCPSPEHQGTEIPCSTAKITIPAREVPRAPGEPPQAWVIAVLPPTTIPHPISTSHRENNILPTCSVSVHQCGVAVGGNLRGRDPVFRVLE